MLYEVITFTPHSIPGVAVNPLNKDKKCYGVDLREIKYVPEFTLRFFLEFYNKYENKDEFLTRERWFNLLAGTDSLIGQIRQGMTEKEIKESWFLELQEYKTMRAKYLLYPDFE